MTMRIFLVLSCLYKSFFQENANILVDNMGPRGQYWSASVIKNCVTFLSCILYDRTLIVFAIKPILVYYARDIGQRVPDNHGTALHSWANIKRPANFTRAAGCKHTEKCAHRIDREFPEWHKTGFSSYFLFFFLII